MFKQLTFLLVNLLLAAAVHAQILSDQPATVPFDSSTMKVGITMDRNSYLPGEVAEITLEVWNPGPAMIAPKPFSWSSGCIYHARKVGDEFKDEMYPPCFAYDLTNENATTFAAGARKQKTFHSYDPLFESQTPFLPDGGGVPSTAGTYRLMYRYSSSVAMAEFEVVSPKLEAQAVVRVNDVLFTEHPGLELPKSLKYYVHVLALRAGNVSYICVAQRSVVPDSEVFADAEGNLNLLVATPLKRIATSAAAIVSISATADRNEGLTIDWVDATGGRQTRYHMPAYPNWNSRAKRQ